MSSNESDKPREDKSSAVDMRAVLLPQGPSEIDLRATAAAPPPTMGEAPAADFAPLPDAAPPASETSADGTAEQPVTAAEDLDATTEFTALPTTPPGEEGALGEHLDAPPAGGLLAGVAAGEIPAEDEPPPEEPEEEQEAKPSLFARIAEHINAYDMLLFVAFVALLLGTLCLAQELSNYKWDTKAREGRRPVSAANPTRTLTVDVAVV